MSWKADVKSVPKPRRAAMLEGRVTETVVGGAALAVLQNVIGFVDFLEAVLAILIARIFIGMPFHRELAKGGLDLLVASPRARGRAPRNNPASP